ncbi:sensor histidine kinase [Kitasatospora sp. NPDC057965]|uniref:sensor histidine kinase n=1 Tax=Kitasatospora sp. NPDC057965 TaxID=3346291 RepID=UPI0036D93FFB
MAADHLTRTPRPRLPRLPGLPSRPPRPSRPSRPARRPETPPPGPTALLGWYGPDRSRLTETLLLVTVLILLAEETASQWLDHGLPLRPLRIAGAALTTLSLLLTRRHPIAAAVLPALFSGLLNRAFPGLFSVFHLASTGRVGPAFVFGAAIALLSAIRADSVVAGVGITGSQLLVEAAAVAVGLWLHGRRALIRTLNAKVEALRRERELRAEQARAAERARIAREMHDVLAHRLSLLVLHTGVLRDQARAGTVADDLDRLAHRLELLRATAARSLDDLRDVLGALRADPPDQPEPPAPPAPPAPPGPPDRAAQDAQSPPPSDGTADRAAAAPSDAERIAVGDGTPPARRGPDPRPVAAPALRDLAELVGEATGAGQNVELALAGDPESIPTTHRLAVHRVVQEALTNARKYAHTAAVTVRVQYGAPTTTVEVRNGPGDPAPSGACTGGGYGLVGLGERIGALGGHFDAGPDGGGGFRLSARLPAPQRPPVRPPARPPAQPSVGTGPRPGPADATPLLTSLPPRPHPLPTPTPTPAPGPTQGPALTPNPPNEAT